ncbi:ribosomal subunit interface protein [Candidatus Giovannonibacteria bacterium RIFCSPLOWO2_01_FULL_44_40]|uniref:Ribosomal subunit interface protein n=1 Tax=Candidatus Giovannonibacteria bacterium RIFCSPHIGHO2_01_FULL_45_23 TaxID=1798325 RepID=A0A1F5VH08_9BACT|nr:MAG: ribosomal subunit interface protein [Candidatus Giovannonibacteria bacterium RIFCSPHIGHO2_01_FULL_45_23]OGF75719.1 MAG: ribosomal subunit interface protein [Candidatus Giovannonibacteria bacterium RIFCSPHIGHO2_02_FULL_45_13]OGF79956.1 MAG: ribosomal subunit interface protein [Candidatus Giovannonibacteria bacterium RIFCSPLOWO2_01_FULL_44_40]
MRVLLKGTNIKLLESTREYVDTKLVKMTKKFLARDNEPIALNIEVGKTTRHHKTGKVFRAETNLKIGKTLLRAEALGESLNEAIDLLEEELEREIKKFKERKRALMLKGARRLKGK